MPKLSPPLNFSGYSRRVADLRRDGVTRSRLQARDVVRAAHGIVMQPGAVGTQTTLGRCLALLPALSGGQFYSRRSALALFGIPVEAPEQIEVGAPYPQRAPRRPEILGHRVRADTVDVHRLRDMPVAAPADAWCLAAPVLSREELVIAGDALLSGVWRQGRRSPPLIEMPSLIHAVRRHEGTNGTHARREALPLLRDRVDSPAETLLRLCIVDAGLPEPTVSCPVQTERRLFHADLGYAALQIAIEYEGAYHFQGGVDQARRDIARWEAMTGAGWRVLRVTSHDLRNPRIFLERLRRAIAERLTYGSQIHESGEG